MPWLKDAVSQKPKTVYHAPPEVYPMVRVIYDPKATQKWTVVYAYLQDPAETQGTIEALIGV
jgi:hypothetical protein